MKPDRQERLVRARLMPRTCGLILVFLMLVRLAAAEAVEEGSPPSLSAAGTGLGEEEELAPVLESNRQPLGPDPLMLPQWSDEELAALDSGRPVNLGGGLWTAERFPLQPAPPWPRAAPAAATAEPGVLGWEVMSQYGAAREWCVDPQKMIEPGRRARLEAHLASHAQSAVHPVRLWVLARGQSPSAVLDEAMMHRASFGRDQPGVLAVVSAVEPEAARIVLPPALEAQGASWRALVVSRLDPMAVSANRFDQLVLWMTLEADTLPAVGAAGGGSHWHAAAATVAPPSRARAPFPLWVWLVVGSIVLAAGLRWIRRRRRQQGVGTSEPVRWMVVERPTRLGGPHSGGSGAVAEW